MDKNYNEFRNVLIRNSFNPKVDTKLVKKMIKYNNKFSKFQIINLMYHASQSQNYKKTLLMMKTDTYSDRFLDIYCSNNCYKSIKFYKYWISKGSYLYTKDNNYGNTILIEQYEDIFYPENDIRNILGKKRYYKCFVILLQVLI